jgi:hypothetical protein
MRLGRPAEAWRIAEQGAQTAAELERPGDRALAELQIALAARDLGRRDQATAAWARALATSECGDAPCGLDRAETTVLRAVWWAGEGDLDAAFQTLTWSIDHPSWTATMLEVPELGVLRGDPRWTQALERLASRASAQPVGPS